MYLFLWDLLKTLLVVCGLIFVIDLMYVLLTEPFKRREKERQAKDLSNELTEAIKKSILDAIEKDKDEKN